MSALQQMLLVGGSIVQPFTAWSVIGDSVEGVTASATLTVKSDGTVTGVGADANDTIPGSSNWFSPGFAGVGNGYYVRFTATSGSFTTNGASTFTALSSDRSVTKSATTGSLGVTFTIEIATDAGGTNIVFTSTGNGLTYNHTL